MKKLLTILFLISFAITSFAQSNFFSLTSYRGALDPDSTKDWTKGWTNWDPQNIVYGSTNVVVNSGNITSNTTWTKNNIYLLNNGYVYVTNNATLTIEAGTVIRGAGKGTLIICRGAKIIARGTLAEPIVFTSNNAIGIRNNGDWGGIVITGKAIHNLPQGDTAAVEADLAKPVIGNGLIDGRHGGIDDNDSSGVLTYVRIEFAGISLSGPHNEINGLSLYSVGRKTQIDHIMVSYCGDDSYEWFGGAANSKYLIAYASIDDDFDTDNGFHGNIQFGIGVRNPYLADFFGTSNGIESDNDAYNFSYLPRTSAVFSNMTLIGPYYTGQTVTPNSKFGSAVEIRRNSALSVVNSIFTGYPTAGLLISSRRTNAALQIGIAIFKNNIIAGIPLGYAGRLATNSDTLSLNTSSNVAAWVVANATDTFTTSNQVNLIRPFLFTNPSYVPGYNSAALIGANFNTGKTPFDAKPAVDFTFTNSSLICSFTNTTVTNGLATSYTWDFGVPSVSTDTSSAINPVYNYPANANYSVTLKARNMYDSSTIIKNIFFVNPCPDTITTQPTNQIGNKGSNKTISFAHSGTGNSYQWQSNAAVLGWQNVPNVTPYTGATTNSLTVNNLTVSNHNQLFRVVTSKTGCKDTSNAVSLTLANITTDSLRLLRLQADSSRLTNESIVYLARINKLMNDSAYYTSRIFKLSNDSVFYVSRIAKLTNDSVYYTGRITKLISDSNAFIARINKLSNDSIYYLSRINKLSNDSVYYTGRITKLMNDSNVFVARINKLSYDSLTNLGRITNLKTDSINNKTTISLLNADIVTKGNIITFLQLDTTNKGITIRQLQTDLANKHDTVYIASTITSDTLRIAIRTGILSTSPIINSLKVYPNPASTLLYIDLEKPGYFIAKLSSITGQSIITPTSGTIDVSSLANGVYILTIYDSNNKLISTNKVAIIK